MPATLSATERLILNCLAAADRPLSQTDIAVASGTPSATVTSLISPLVRFGLVTRIKVGRSSTYAQPTAPTSDSLNQ